VNLSTVLHGYAPRLSHNTVVKRKDDPSKQGRREKIKIREKSRKLTLTSWANKEWKACLRRRGFRRYRCCCCTGATRSGTCAPRASPQDIQHRTVARHPKLVVVVVVVVDCRQRGNDTHTRRSGGRAGDPVTKLEELEVFFWFSHPTGRTNKGKRGGMDWRGVIKTSE
jgi:hypothetical protein